MQPTDFSTIDAARTTAQDAATSALDYGSTGNVLADELRKAVGERFAASPIAQEATTNRANFL